MTAAPLLEWLRERGVRLEAEGERLRYRAPRGALTPELRALLRARKAELLAALRTGASAARLRPAPGSPAAALRADWRAAWLRASERFATERVEPDRASLLAAATLELRTEEDAGSRARVADRLLPLVYAGALVARLAPDGTLHVAASADAIDLATRPAPDARPGLMRCEGCAGWIPEPGPYCAACDLGLDHAAAEGSSALYPAALELRRQRGPAGARGVRQEEVEKLARKGGRSETTDEGDGGADA